MGIITERPMTQRLMPAALAVGSIGLGITYGVARFLGEFDPPIPDAVPIIIEGRKHTATAEMQAAAAAREKQAAPAFRAEADDGQTYSLSDLARAGSLALIFIKDGCPCSVAAGPFYGRLAESYGSRVRFFGVIDGNAEVARKWARANHVPFPILADPDLRIVREYKAENSAYFAIIAPDGSIEKYWPGYSADMLREANELLARFAGVEAKLLDVAGAPEDLYTGCPYEL